MRRNRTLAGRIAQRVGLARYNAQRCEQAGKDACRCPCGGSLHGQKHGADWLAEQRERITREENAAERCSLTLDMWGYDNDGTNDNSRV